MGKLIVCVADNNGILFNNRRVSRDEKVIEDILSFTHNIKMSEYSKRLFQGYDTIDTSSEYWFIESPVDDFSDVEEIIIYKWNRDYPADTFFSFDQREYALFDAIDFTGKSHERITKEIWKRN